MLKSLVEHKLPANFLIIADTEDVGGQDLFISFLKNYQHDSSIKQIHLICLENPPEFYNQGNEIRDEKVVCHNFFTDPCGWNNPTIQKQDLSIFTSDPKSLCDAAIFIDSLSLLAYHQGFFTMCKDLNILKRYSKSVLCGVHDDLFSPEQLEELYFFATAYIKLKDYSTRNINKEKMCEVTYKKPGGKVIKQVEFYSVSDEFKVTSKISQTKPSVVSDTKKDIESLSTFKLGLNISEEEKKARDELVLPYLRTEGQNKTGEIIYQPEADDFEDDPDDDLDI